MAAESPGRGKCFCLAGNWFNICRCSDSGIADAQMQIVNRQHNFESHASLLVLRF
jgi:hypothetical protein